MTRAEELLPVIEELHVLLDRQDENGLSQELRRILHLCREVRRITNKPAEDCGAGNHAWEVIEAYWHCALCGQDRSIYDGDNLP